MIIAWEAAIKVGGGDVHGRTNAAGARLHGCTIPWMEEVERRRERAAEEVVRSMEPEPMDAQARSGKRHDFLVVAIAALQPQKSVGENGAIEKGVGV